MIVPRRVVQRGVARGIARVHVDAGHRRVAAGQERRDAVVAPERGLVQRRAAAAALDAGRVEGSIGSGSLFPFGLTCARAFSFNWLLTPELQ